LTYGQKTSQDVSYMMSWDETVLMWCLRAQLKQTLITKMVTLNSCFSFSDSPC